MMTESERAELAALRRENAELRAWQAETRMVLTNTAITPQWRVMSLLLWEIYSDRLGRADPDTGDLPIHIPEVIEKYGGCEKQAGAILTTMGAAGCIGYRVEKTQTETGEYRSRARFRPPATTREAYCGVVAGWSHESGVGRPVRGISPEEKPLMGYAVTYEQTYDIVETSGPNPRIVSKTPRTAVRVAQTPRIDLDEDRATEIEARLVAQLRGIPITPAGKLPRDTQPWPGKGNYFQRSLRKQTKTPTPPDEPEEWGREAWPLAP